MKRCCILHLSDLHIDMDEDYNFIMLREELKNDIQKQVKQNDFTIDVIAITGDVINKGKEESFNNAKLLVEDILQELKIDKSKVVIVPGNHDIPRDNELSSKLDEHIDELNDIKFLGGNWSKFNERFGEFNSFVGEFYGTDIALVNSSFGIKDVVINNMRLRFILLNTAWTTRGDKDYGKLRLGRAQLEYLRKTNRVLNEEYESDLCIAVTHHPLDWLEIEEREMVQDYLTDRRKLGVDVILHGHIHDAKIEMLINPEGSILKLVSGIGYPKSQLREKGQPKICSCRYSIYKFDIDENLVEIISRISNDRGVFGPDNGLYRCEEENGHHYMPIKINNVHIRGNMLTRNSGNTLMLQDINKIQVIMIGGGKGEIKMELNSGEVIVIPQENEIVSGGVWNSPEGLQLPKVMSGTKVLELAQQLRQKEIKSYYLNYQAQNFEIVAESVWYRAVAVLREKVLGLGENFVAEMVGVKELEYVRELPTFEVINVAAELGFINKTGRMRLKQANEIVQHYLSRDIEDEMPQNEVDTVIRAATQYILGYDDIHMKFEYNDFRERLKTSLIEQQPETLNMLKGGPYFYKKTTIRTLINLMNEAEAGEFDIVVSNMIAIFTSIWEDLVSDDKHLIGLTYAQYQNNGDIKLIKPFKSVLLKVHGFDYVPENLRSFTFIEAGKRIMEAHNSINNFYNEGEPVRNLEKLGHIIPKPALKTCISALLMVKLGNFYGVAWSAQNDADIILDKLQREDWRYYLEKCLPNDIDILWKIGCDDNRTQNWMNIVNKYRLHELEIFNKDIKKILLYSSQNKQHVTSSVASQMYNSLT